MLTQSFGKGTMAQSLSGPQIYLGKNNGESTESRKGAFTVSWRWQLRGVHLRFEICIVLEVTSRFSLGRIGLTLHPEGCLEFNAWIFQIKQLELKSSLPCVEGKYLMMHIVTLGLQRFTLSQCKFAVMVHFFSFPPYWAASCQPVACSPLLQRPLQLLFGMKDAI